MADCLFDGNDASGAGGALFLNGSADVTLSDRTLLLGNTGTSGGSIWLESATLTYRLPAPLGRWIESYGQPSARVLGSISSDFPNPCAPGLMGLDSEHSTQGISACSGLCTAGHRCRVSSRPPRHPAYSHFPVRPAGALVLRLLRFHATREPIAPRCDS